MTYVDIYAGFPYFVFDSVRTIASLLFSAAAATGKHFHIINSCHERPCLALLQNLQRLIQK